MPSKLLNSEAATSLLSLPFIVRIETQNNEALGIRVLLVEDEQFVRERFRSLLSRAHCNVVEANNGAEALTLFHRGQFDLVILDFEIPFIKGDEVAVRIKRVVPCQPILMISARARFPGPDNPVDAVLGKACTPRQLWETIAALLAKAAMTVTETEAAAVAG
jgi:DNA-binding response OmpR family regulator